MPTLYVCVVDILTCLIIMFKRVQAYRPYWVPRNRSVSKLMIRGDQRANVQPFSNNLTVNSDLSGSPISKSEIPVFFTLQSSYFPYFR
jgi:hypothetical protein